MRFTLQSAVPERSGVRRWLALRVRTADAGQRQRAAAAEAHPLRGALALDDLDLNGETTPTESVLGVNVRTDVPVAGYLLVGPMFEFGSYEPGYYFNLDFYARARVPIDAKSVQFQIWAGMPIGLTFSFLSGDFARNLEGFSLGWNIGVLLGGAVHFSRQFGIFTEGGWQQQRMTHDREGGGSLSITLKPWVWNVGFVFRD
jgi:hypothetical protein